MVITYEELGELLGSCIWFAAISLIAYNTLKRKTDKARIVSILTFAGLFAIRLVSIAIN